MLWVYRQAIGTILSYSNNIFSLNESAILYERALQLFVTLFSPSSPACLLNYYCSKTVAPSPHGHVLPRGYVNGPRRHWYCAQGGNYRRDSSRGHPCLDCTYWDTFPTNWQQCPSPTGQPHDSNTLHRGRDLYACFAGILRACRHWTLKRLLEFAGKMLVKPSFFSPGAQSADWHSCQTNAHMPVYPTRTLGPERGHQLTWFNPPHWKVCPRSPPR